MLKRILPLVVALLLAGCGSSPTHPSTPPYLVRVSDLSLMAVPCVPPCPGCAYPDPGCVAKWYVTGRVVITENAGRSLTVTDIEATVTRTDHVLVGSASLQPPEPIPPAKTGTVKLWVPYTPDPSGTILTVQVSAGEMVVSTAVPMPIA